MAWEKIDDTYGRSVMRRAVPGGWIYLVKDTALFVPYPPVTEDRETTSRDDYELGYDRGYNDGYNGQDPVYPARDHKVTPEHDLSEANYQTGYNRGFNDALHGAYRDELANAYDRGFKEGCEVSQPVRERPVILDQRGVNATYENDNEPDKVTPEQGDTPEHDDFGFEDKPEVDENSPAYARGIAIGFDMARKQFVGDKVTPSNELHDLLWEAASALQAEGYQHDDPIVAKLYAAANKLEGKS